MHGINIGDKMYISDEDRDNTVDWSKYGYCILKTDYREPKDFALVDIYSKFNVLLAEQHMVRCRDLSLVDKSIETTMHNILVNLNKLEKKIIKQK